MVSNDFRETQLGSIPQSWNLVQLGDLASTIANSFVDGPFGSDLKVCDFFDNGEARVIQLQNIGIGSFFDINHKYIDGEKYKVLIRHETLPNDIVIAKMADPVGRACIVPPLSDKFMIVADCMRLRPNQKLTNNYFLMWALNSHIVRGQAEKLATGTTRQRISLSNAKKLIIPLPPLPEQRAIAHVLSTVRQSIEATERVIVAAKELKRSLMKYMFTFGPVPIDQADQVSTKDTDFGRVPQAWSINALEKCAYVQTGTAKGRKYGKAQTIIVPYLRVANVQDGYLDLTDIKQISIKDSEFNKYQLQPGDVLMTEGGDFDKLGRGYIWRGEIKNCIHQNHIFAVRVNREVLMPEYFAYLIQSDYGKAYFLKVAHRTTHLASINSTKLKAFPALIPTLEEQNRIISALAGLDTKLHTETERKFVLETMFTTLLHHLMTGKHRVPVTRE
jgi:type I restriction enzyme, S subunit